MSQGKYVVSRRRLVLAIAAGIVALSPIYLTACGSGGGGNGMVKPSPPAPPPSPPPPPPPPPSYDAVYNQLIPTGVQTAQKEGFTGKGVNVGIMDSGADPTTAPLNGRIAWFKSYLSGGSQSANDTTGHGSAVADILGGLPAGTIPRSSVSPNGETFPGGVATRASLFVEQVCASDGSCNWNTGNYNDFVAQNVKIINESLGSGDAQTDQPSAGTQALYQPAVDAGILQVWATGNDGTKQPWDEAGLPYWIPGFQPTWLAVVNVAIDSNGKPSGLYEGNPEPSNACGVAAAWCIGAPGVEGIPPNSKTPGGTIIGTSFATAVVSGVAAQVWQAFPWMTAANISDTILTTATPMDDGSGETPNPTYGWGFINAAKAVNGPAQFAFPQFGPFTANVTSGMSSVFSNDIAGAGGLKLTGPGTLVLTGTDTYQGGSEIAAGTLRVDGSVASAVTVDAGGNLVGVGTVGADVTNNGTVTSQGSAAAQGLTINGNLTDGASSTTAVALGDPLQVKGTAAVAGAMNVLGAPSGYTVKSTENLLTAGNVSGTFASLTFASGVYYTGTLSYTATGVDVALTQSSVTGTAGGATMKPYATSETKTSANNVQGALNVSNGWFVNGQTGGHEAWFADAGKFLLAPDAAYATASLNSLSGEIYATSRAVEAQQSLATDAALANREQDLANNAAPGVWVQALGADGTLARSGYESASYRASGMMAGIDGSFGAGFSAGVAAGRTHSNATMTALGGYLDGRENVVAAYGRWDAGNGWYGAGRISYASIKNGVNRQLLLGTTLTPLMGGRTDHVTLGTLEGGKAIDLGGSTLTPYVSVSDLHLSQNGFTEQGSAMGLTAPSQTHDATFGTAGLRYGHGFDWSLGHSWLNGYIAYRRVFSGADLGMDASFNGVPDSAFEAEGQNLPHNLVIVGVGLNTKVNARWSWYMDTDYQGGSEGAHQVEADVGLRITL